MLIKNIKSLLQVRSNSSEWVSGPEMDKLPSLENSYLVTDGTQIKAFGKMNECPTTGNDEVIDASGAFVLPAFVDSHSHIVFAESREEEFVAKIKGASYAEIAAQGGGILNSAKKVNLLTEEELFERAMPRVEELIRFGTGCLEIKSGYGLTTENELKILKVARRIGSETPLTVKTTFLGAHAIPSEVTNRRFYIDQVINEMIPAVAQDNLADYIDVFCEEGFFTPEETTEILEAGIAHGMMAKLHANQLGISGGVEVGVALGARSVDHLECIAEAQITALKNGKTMPTLLPGSAFYLNNSYPPARQMIDSGLPVALATDYNPGSAPAGNMSFMLSLACIKMKMTPNEAINAATLNGAFAMDVLDKFGTISIGKEANLIITKPMENIALLPYAFTSNNIDKVILNGVEEYSNYYD